MPSRIELSVHLRNRIPPLIVPMGSTILEPMDTAHAKAFADRLNRALSLVDLPGKFRGRNVMLAKRMGVTVRTVSNWLNGEKLPSADRMIQLSEVLGVSVDWLWVGRGPMLLADLPTDDEIAILRRIRRLPPQSRPKVDQIIDMIDLSLNG